MIWKEKGVEKDSYMCFFSPDDTYKNMFLYMFSCGYFHTNSDYLYESVGNRPPLFVYIVSGTMHLEYEGQHYCANTNEIILINCNKYNKYYCSEHCEFLFFHFAGNTAETITEQLILANNSPIFNLSQPENIYLVIYEPIMQLCYQECHSDSMLSSIVYATLTKLHHSDAGTNTVGQTTSESPVITGAIDYIKAHINSLISLDELAEYVGLSPFYFSRFFKKETGVSPMEYVSIMKINYAKLMLRTTNASVNEIADYLGYSSASSFINAFRLRRGISPNQYRNRGKA